MNLKHKIAAIGLAGVLALTGCAVGATTSATTTSATAAAATADTTATTADDGPGSGRGGGDDIDASAVTTEDQLVALVEEAYGDGGLGLHRGHQGIEEVLNEVLGISHEELHVRMDAGQNLSAVAEDLGIDTQTLVDALVAAYSPAIDNMLAAGTLTQDQADAYLQALEDAFTFRVTWDGQQAAPTFSGIEA